MRVLLDGMGGDNAPQEIVKGAVDAANESQHEIQIIGREEDIYLQLEKYDYPKDRISVINATEVISNDESPVWAIRKKKDSSMVKGLNMLKEGKGDVFVSAGSTGALMAGALMILKRIPGIERPAIATIYPIIGGRPSIIVDAGANADCKAWNILDFAIMGSLYMEKVMGRKDATVGLVNIGAEDSKGNELTKEAFPMLKEADINFIGNVEAREVPKGACDVIVCDGFTGNVILKLSEGFASNMLKYLKQKFTEGVSAKVGAAILLPKIKGMMRETNYEEEGGAPILGVNGHVIKMHGSSEAFAVKNAVLKGAVFAENDIVGQISNEMEKINDRKS